MIWAFLYPVGCSNEPTGLLKLAFIQAAPLPQQQPKLPNPPLDPESSSMYRGAATGASVHSGHKATSASLYLKSTAMLAFCFLIASISLPSSYLLFQSDYYAVYSDAQPQ